MAHKSYKYRIHPSKRQTQTLNDHLAICCELYNAALQERREAWRLERKSIRWFDQNRQLCEIKQVRTDVAALNNYALEATLKRVDLAFASFFRRAQIGQKAGYPRFRAFHQYDSFTLRSDAAPMPLDNKLRISKVGYVKISLHRPIEGTIKTLTIKREVGRWFAIFICEVESRPLPFSPNTIGVDVGLTSLATLSDGRTIENPRYYRNAQRALRVAQRRIARRKKGSNRRAKAVVLLQRLHAHVRAQRNDFQHKLSHYLVANYGAIFVEDLNIKGLARGMLSKPINDAAWGDFLFKTSYKAENAGRVFRKVKAAGTSQTCTCGAVVSKTLADRWHLCLNCGLSLPRDHVSALVIELRGQADHSNVNVGALRPCVV